MKEYDAKTKPLLQVFEKMGVLINCEAKKGVKDYPELKKMVEQKLAQIWSSSKIYFRMVNICYSVQNFDK